MGISLQQAARPASSRQPSATRCGLHTGPECARWLTGFAPFVLPVHAVIKDFCKLLGVDNKQVQGVIRLAKKNGERLGFLA